MKKNKFQIIATINTSKADRTFIRSLIEGGVTILRINGAHVLPENVNHSVLKLRSYCSDLGAKIMLDLPGNKIRTTGLLEDIILRKGEKFELNSNNFNFPNFIQYLKPNNIVFSSDAQLKMKVNDVQENIISFESLTDGSLMNNKGMHLQNGNLMSFPFITERDHKLINSAIESNVDFLSLSFVRNAENILLVKDKIKNSSIELISKLETREGTQHENLHPILEQCSYFSIDRGDLFSEVGIENFPDVFFKTLNEVIKKKKKLFIATQLFASMYNHNTPYLSEIIEFARLVKEGIYGIQLSEETAIGKYPLDVLSIISKLL